jgi:uncharacterized protein YhaN
MKFLRVAFRCFGPFDDQTLELSGAEGFHVVFGPNEAGKSSALRGLYGFLFGFPVRSSDDFRFKYGQFRVHAVLENTEGKTLECIRRKGNKATLRASDDKTEVAESALAQYLGGLQQQQFEQLFALDSSRLIEGGRDIAEGRGDLGEALFAAGAGLAGLRALAQSLEDRKAELYRFRGQTQPINKALSERENQVAAVRENTLPPETYAAAVTAARETEDTAGKLRNERTLVRTQLGLLQRFQAALPAIELLQRARQRLQPVADAPILAAEFHARLSKARELREIARSKLMDLAADRDELEQQLREQQPPAAVLAEEARIDELKKLVGADAKEQSEAIKADTRRSEEESQARDIYRQLTGSTAWEQMPGLKPRLDNIQRITELANEHKAVVEDVTLRETAVRLAREALVISEAKQASAVATIDPAPWLAAVDAITALGPVEQQARDRQSEAAGQELALVREFAQLAPAPDVKWSESTSLAVPSAELVAQFRQRFDEAQKGIADAKGECERIDREIVTIREQLVAAAGAEAVPTTNDLAEARRDRDGGVHLIRRRLAEQSDLKAESEFTDRHAPGRPLIDAAEVSVRQCDALADRLRHEADRVAAWHRLHHQLELLEVRREKAAITHAGAEAELTDITAAWQAAWRPTGIAAESPQVMLGWLNHWHRLTERVSAWSALQLKCAEDERLIARLRAQLADMCPLTQNTKTLAEGVALTRQVGADAKNEQGAAEKLKEEILRLRSALQSAENELTRAAARHDNWTKEWSAAIAPIGLGESSVSIDTVQDYLSNIDRMQHHLSEMRIKAARVREVAEDRALLLERISALRSRLDPTAQLTTADTLDAHFRQLDASLASARDRRAQHEQRAKQLEKVKADFSATSDSLRLADASLADLASQAGVSNVDEITRAIQRASERAIAERQVRDHEGVLSQNARGEPLDQFIAAALEHRERLDQEIDSLDRRAGLLDPEVAAAEAKALEAANVLKGYQQASDAAAEARQRAELIGARLEEHVIEFAASHLAGVVLDRAKERYRASHQDSLLDRAGEFFKTLTDHAFEGLDIDNEEGTDVLKAVRARDHSSPRVPVDGLSDGTRDQLFLALRLAGIERHLVDREPVPLIIDDVLVSFDDARARATLKCLAELASKTQVLLFTHHRHVVKLAIAVNPQTVVQELVPAGGS